MALPPSAYPNVADVPFSIQQNNTNKDHSAAPIPHLPPKMPNRKIPPVPLPPSIYHQNANNHPFVRTPLPYVTPAATPFVTAPNTPAFNNGSAFPNPQLPAGQPFIIAQPTIAPNAVMAPCNGIPLQQFTFPTVSPPSTQQANGPINVVVNANANSAAEGGDGIGLGADGKKMKLCPNCRKGVIIREQHRTRARKIKAIAFLTSCCLFCLPCVLLQCNYTDQCRACHVVYGKTGGKKPKKVKYA